MLKIPSCLKKDFKGYSVSALFGRVKVERREKKGYNDPYKSEQKTEELDEPKIEKEETNESSNEEESPQQ